MVFVGAPQMKAFVPELFSEQVCKRTYISRSLLAYTKQCMSKERIFSVLLYVGLFGLAYIYT